MSLQLAVVSDVTPIPQPLSLVEEISHRVVNECTDAICMLTTAAASPANTQARATLTWVANRLRAQAEVHANFSCHGQ